MPPERAIDGDLQTAWMAEGDGEWIRFDCGSIRILAGMKLAFSSADKRVYTFDVQVSETGADEGWATMLDKAKTSGTTLRQERFAFPAPMKARYVRVVGHGNTSTAFPRWCNVTEATVIAE